MLLLFIQLNRIINKTNMKTLIIPPRVIFFSGQLSKKHFFSYNEQAKLINIFGAFSCVFFEHKYFGIFDFHIDL